MHELEVPLALTGLEIDRDERFREQVVARTVAAVFVDRRRLDREIDDAGLRIGRDLGPDTVVASVFRRSVLPRLVAEFALTWNAVERPELFAGARVERSHLPLHVGGVFVAEALEHRRADDDHIADDRGCRVQADLRFFVVGLLAVDHDAVFEIDFAVLAKAGDRLTGLGVQRDEAITDGDVNDAVVALAVGPIGESATRQLARRPPRCTLAFFTSVGPLQFAGARIGGDHRAPGARRGVEHALDHQRRAFELRFGTGTEVIGLDAPRDFQLAEVVAVNLIERRVLRSAKVRGVHRPLAVLGARHRAGLSGHEGRDPRVARDEQRDSGHDPKCDALHALLTPDTGKT